MVSLGSTKRYQRIWKNLVSTHDISKSSVEEEAFTPLVPVVGISIQFDDDVLHDDKAVVHLQLIHLRHFPVSFVVVRITFFSSCCILICKIYQILKELYCVEEVETLQRCDWHIKNMDRTWMPRIFWVTVTLCRWNIISTCPFKSQAHHQCHYHYHGYSQKLQIQPFLLHLNPNHDQ